MKTLLAKTPISKLLQEPENQRLLKVLSRIPSWKNATFVAGGSRGSKCNDLLVASAPLDGKLDSELAADVVDLF